MALEKREIVLDITVIESDARKRLDTVNVLLTDQRKALADLQKGYKAAQKTIENYDSAQTGLNTRLETGVITQAEYDAQLAELNGELKRAEAAVESYGASYTELKTEINALSKEQRGLLTDLANVEKATKSAEGSNEKLKAELALLTKQYNSLSKEQRETSKEGQDLTRQIREISDALKENESAIGDNRRNVGNYLGALEDWGTNIQANITSMIGPAGLASALAIVGQKLIEGAQYVIEISEEFTRLRGEVQRLTGETGDDLDGLVVKIRAISETFEADFNEVLLTANAISKQFGISQAEAVEIIETGFLAGADASGELLSVLQEYPAQLAAVGLSAEESLSIITQQVQEGIFSDKGVDAIKEAGIRLRELTPATATALEGIGLSSRAIEQGLRDGTLSLFEVIQQVSGAIDKLPENSKEVGAALADIFGGPGEDAGVKYIKTLKDAKTGLDELVDPSNKLTQIQIAQLKATEDLADAQNELAKIFGGTSSELSVLTTQIQAELIRGLVVLIEELKPVVEGFKGFVSILKGVFNAIQFVIDKINDVREFFGLARHEIDATKSAFSFLATVITQAFGLGLLKAITGAKEAVSDLVSGVTRLFNTLKSLSNQFFGTEFELQISTDEAEQKIIDLQAVLAGTELPEPEPPNFDRFNQFIAAEKKRVAEKEKTDKEEKQRQDQLLKEKIAGVELALLEVKRGSAEELQLQKDLIQAKSELAIQGARDTATQQLLIARRAAIEQQKLDESFRKQQQLESLDLIRLEGEAILRVSQIQLEEDVKRAFSSTELSTRQQALSNETTETQIEGMRRVTEQEQVQAILRDEISNLSTTKQIEFIQKVLESETLTTQERETLIKRLAALQEQKEQENLELIVRGAQVFTQVQEVIIAANQAKLATLEKGSQEAIELEEKIARQQKILAISNAVINTAVAITKTLPNIPLSIVVGALGAVQIAKIIATKFAEGGFTSPVGIPDPDIPGRKIVGVVHDHEYVIPTKVLKTTKGKHLTTQLETLRKQLPGFQAGGFTSFQDGGLSTVTNRTDVQNTFSIGKEFAKELEKLPPPEVNIKEFKRVETRVRVKENNASI